MMGKIAKFHNIELFVVSIEWEKPYLITKIVMVLGANLSRHMTSK